MEKPVTAASLHRQADGQALRALSASRIVLVSPSHPGNIGATARAMTTMGLSDLVVVAPRFADFARHDEAIAFAGHGLDRLQAARRAESLSSAVADCQLVIGVSAEPRAFGPPPRAPGPTVRDAFQRLIGGELQRIAWVFGTERTGLSIDEVGLCHWLTSIPADPARSSLNLAQAVQIISYALRDAALALDEADPRAGVAPVTPADPPDRPRADHAAVEGFYAHLERAMIACGFLDPAVPKRLMPRMRRLFGRAGLDPDEVDLLRGLCTRIERIAAVPPATEARQADPADRRR